MSKQFDKEELELINKLLEENEQLFEELRFIEAIEKIHRHEGESMEACVSRGIATLMNEGYERDQAAAASYSMCGEGKANDKGTLQTIVISKEIAKSLQEASSKAKKYGEIRTSRETDSSYRFAQRSPDDFQADSYKSFSPEKGVTLVYGKLKGSKDFCCDECKPK